MRADGEIGGGKGANPCAETNTRSGNSQCSPGQILVVGLGPGDRELLTPQAEKALKDSQVIIGYRTYTKLIAHLAEGKEVISSGMRREKDRAYKAVEMAEQGVKVAVISSGDPGIYGMAGIILEITSDRVPVTIIPGITAASAAASAVGAPLMNDFVIISLSDLLTPWEKIIKRLEAAGQGDLVTVLYNPKSTERQENLSAARDVLLKYQCKNTPVALVRNAKRGDEEIVITDLNNLHKEYVDMLTVVIVGNSETYLKDGRMITPRGYPL